MNVGVVGLWHLGMVTAACLAAAGHTVIAVDNATTIGAIEAGTLPVAEPGLAQLVADERASARLVFSADVGALCACELIWITYDTPVDRHDRADVQAVVSRVQALIDRLDRPATIVVSSQLPVGSIARLEDYVRAAGKSSMLSFAAIPENLRLGSAIAYFRAPDRTIVGVRDPVARERVARVLEPFVDNIIWMRIESAEMTKHALNAFLATSISFANEIAGVCERVGADAREVEAGLKSDVRIGHKAYVRAGQAFAGGTLARDLGFLTAIGARTGATVLQIEATRASNDVHKNWLDDAIAVAIEGIADPIVALLGLVYKPGTDTLRASTAVALAHRLRDRGIAVRGFDPAIACDNAELRDIIEVGASAGAALAGSDVAVIATPWPSFGELSVRDFSHMRRCTIVDPDRFIEAVGRELPAASYVAFGVGSDVAVAAAR